METHPLRSAALLGDRYRLGQLIGRGGMAEVYRATDERLGREVAVKLFRPGVAAVEDLRRVRAEIRTLAALAHPGLVMLHDAADGDDGSPAFLVLELVRGSDLGALIRTGALSTSESVALVREIAQTLTYIHARGIVHRDIKPENILVARGEDGSLHAKLADLGIARILGDSRLTEAGAVIGTAAYLSPEQVMGEEVGTEADVYALGLVLLEALTGRPAYEGGKLEQALARVNRPPAIPDWLDDADAVLVEDMTARDPADRPSARETVTELAAWTSPDLPWDDADPGADDAGVTAIAAGGTAVWRDGDDDLEPDEGVAEQGEQSEQSEQSEPSELSELSEQESELGPDEGNQVEHGAGAGLGAESGHRTGADADADAATDVLGPRDDARTSVLGAADGRDLSGDSRTEVLGRPAEDAPTAVLPLAAELSGVAGDRGDARTRVPAGIDDSARTELLGNAGGDARTEVLRSPGGDARTEVLGVGGGSRASDPSLGHDPAGTAGPPAPPGPTPGRQRRAELQRIAWRRFGVTVVVLAVLAAAATAAFPAWGDFAPSARADVPAYPSVEGPLAGSLTTLQDAAAGAGATVEAQQRIQADVLQATTTAAGGDFDGTDAALDAVEVSLARAALDDHVTGARYDAIRAAVGTARAEIGPAQDAAAAAAAEAERQRAAAEEAERQRRVELERQAEAERRAEEEREAAEQQDGLGQTLDDIGQGLRDQFERWTQGF